MPVMFGMCGIFLLIASVLQRRLMVVAESHRSSKFSISLVCITRIHNTYSLNYLLLRVLFQMYTISILNKHSSGSLAWACKNRELTALPKI